MRLVYEILMAVCIQLLAFTAYKLGYRKGYGDAVKEYLDNLERRKGKNWHKHMEGMGNHGKEEK